MRGEDLIEVYDENGRTIPFEGNYYLCVADKELPNALSIGVENKDAYGIIINIEKVREQFPLCKHIEITRFPPVEEDE